MKPGRLERTLRRLLKDLATDLRREAQNVPERHVAHFVQYRAPYIAHAIRRKILRDTSREARFDSLQHQKNPPKSIFENLSSPDWTGDSGSGSDSLDDEPLNLVLLEMFILTSKAFETLRNNLALLGFTSSKDGATIDSAGETNSATDLAPNSPGWATETLNRRGDASSPIAKKDRPRLAIGSSEDVLQQCGHLTPQGLGKQPRELRLDAGQCPVIAIVRSAQRRYEIWLPALVGAFLGYFLRGAWNGEKPGEVLLGSKDIS